jgi:hypothetical protein
MPREFMHKRTWSKIRNLLVDGSEKKYLNDNIPTKECSTEEKKSEK